MNRAVELLRLDRRRDLAAQAPIAPDAFTRRPVTDPTGLVVAGADLDGSVLRSPIAQGEPLIPSLLVDAADPRPFVALGLELPTASGVLGRLVAGDRVDVFLTDAEEETHVVARDVRILEIADTEQLSGDRSVRVLIGTDRATAARIAGASHRGAVDLIRVNR